ncbi:hypothetical protein ACFWDI_28375 [Streptomyces sp. NPDC060064]|uniref:hypothetical protein n=1 Tax=Streptomyces sp. NPDC060064 TaxID=3347049 RepID=UPI00368898C5
MQIDHASIQAHLTPAIDDLMDRLGAMVEEDAKNIAPKKTGELAGSIRREVNNGRFRVGSDLDRALWMEEGTKPHVIRPKNAKALFWEGAEHPYALVNHPGTQAQPFLRPALWIKREA